MYMIKSIAEQKMALATENNSIPQLTSNQLVLIDKLISVLNPVEEITQSVSSEKSCASVIIPFIRALRKHLEDHNNDSGIQTMKKIL